MTVRKRHVLFLSGFDPKGASYYHALFKRESAKQGALTGWTYTVGPRQPGSGVRTLWTVEAHGARAQENVTVHSTIEHLPWDDLVRKEWSKGPGQILWESVMAYLHALASGRSLCRVWRVAPKTLFALAWPALCWLAALVIAFTLAIGSAFAVLQYGNGRIAAGWAIITGMAAASASLWWVLRLERKLNTAWLLRIYRFAERWSKRRMPELESRLDNMAARLDEVVADPEIDEVLVVGYSVGSMLAVSLMARRSAAGNSSDSRKLSLLTLGHCIPLLGLMPTASYFRSELATVADAQDLQWIDVSSPTDWGSFALADPVQLCLQRKGFNPRAMVSPRFHLLFDPQRYRQLRKEKRRIHLQYLMSGEKSGEYDYFDMVAGPRHLGERSWTK
jgi:pimeloyl-ACP methyl ester carboxylesterase